MTRFRGKEVADRYIRYRCGTCDELHKDRWEAENCCGPETVLACPVCKEVHYSVEDVTACETKCGGSTTAQAMTCPVCKSVHSTTDAAVDCCQWKTLGFGERYRLARQLDATIY